MSAPETEVRYCLMVPGDQHPIETYPRDEEGFGAITAVNRAQHLSLNGHASVAVFVGDRYLCSYAQGRRTARDI